MSVNLFDVNYYRTLYPDLTIAGLNTDEQLRAHLLNNGLIEGRRFSPFVNLNFYRSSNPDLAQNGISTNRQAFEHLQSNGVSEGRRFSRFADLGFYRSSYGDLASLNNEQLFEHLRNNGVAEGRATSQVFDVSYYLANNSDLRAAGFNYRMAYEHFVLIGFPVEGRYGNPNGYSGPVMDENEGTGTPIFLASEGNLGDYDVPGDGGVNQWQQNSDGPWFATANVQFANGQTTQTIPLAIFGDGVVDGNATITWRISDSAPFGFSQESYTWVSRTSKTSNYLSRLQ